MVQTIPSMLLRMTIKYAIVDFVLFDICPLLCQSLCACLYIPTLKRSTNRILLFIFPEGKVNVEA